MIENKKMPATGTRWQKYKGEYKYDNLIISYLILQKKQKGGENMEKVKAFLSNPWVTLIIGFALGALHNWFNL